jgi:endogenous inhibitor of DNA gyrase (YacG/DUF329 family)
MLNPKGVTQAQERTVQRVMIKCPVTGKDVPTGMNSDEKSWEAVSYTGNTFFCPACRQTHAWNKEDAHLEEAH